MNFQTAQEIRALYDSDQPVRSISKQFGISTSYCYQILRNEVYFDPRYTPSTLKTKVDPDEAWDLMKTGITYAQIAARLSTSDNWISPSLVGYHIRRRWKAAS